jgi:hypothetical protein
VGVERIPWCVMYATAIVGGKIVQFKLSRALARAHRQNRRKNVTNAKAIAFVEAIRCRTPRRRARCRRSTSKIARDG